MSALAEQQYRMIYDIYMMLDDSDRRLLRQFDLSSSQYAALKLLDDSQGLRLTDIGVRLRLDKSTVTRLIDRLERRNLVRRLPEPLDRRVLRVVLTPQGVSLRTAASDAHTRSLSGRMNILSDDDHRQLYLLLDKLCAGLHADLNE